MPKPSSGTDYRSNSEKFDAKYGPNAECQRRACVATGKHRAGEHLDPRSDRYDGPGTTLGALPYQCRGSAQQLAAASREAGWNTRLVNIALHEMADEIRRSSDAAAAAQVDRDRGITEAMTRAEDCTRHGDDLRFERHQSHTMWLENHSLDEQRVVWLSAVQQIAKLCDARTELTGAEEPFVKAIRQIAAGAGRGQDRVRRRNKAPTHADCHKAGRCEHPDTPPHEACQHLSAWTLDTPTDVPTDSPVPSNR